MHLTSVALVPLGIAFVWILLTMIGKPYAGVRAELGHFVPAVIMILFVGASIYHMQLGMRVIIDDYVHDHHLKDWSLIANLFFCAALGIGCVYSLLKVGFAS